MEWPALGALTAMSDEKPEAAATAPQPAAPEAPGGAQNAESLLARYQHVGEDHPSYRKLKEALVRG